MLRIVGTFWPLLILGSVVCEDGWWVRRISRMKPNSHQRQSRSGQPLPTPVKAWKSSHQLLYKRNCSSLIGQWRRKAMPSSNWPVIGQRCAKIKLMFTRPHRITTGQKNKIGNFSSTAQNNGWQGGGCRSWESSLRMKAAWNTWRSMSCRYLFDSEMCALGKWGKRSWLRWRARECYGGC